MEKFKIKPIFITEEDEKFLESQKIFQYYVNELIMLPEELITGQSQPIEQDELVSSSILPEKLVSLNDAIVISQVSNKDTEQSCENNDLVKNRFELMDL